MRAVIIILISIVGFVSCATEKLYPSPMYEGFVALTDSSPKVKFPDNFNDKTGLIFYTSELSSQIQNFPKFSNTALNQEVIVMKYHIKKYVYALKKHNILEREKALRHFEKSYKKIQKLRKYLSTTDDEVINRYLVRIKSNIAQIEALQISPTDNKLP